MTRRAARVIVVVVLVAASAAGWYAYRRSGPHDAAAAGARIDADVRELISELGLREVTPAAVDHLGSGGEDCDVWRSGDDRPLTEGPHLQHRVAYAARPPAGRRVSDLREDAERILRGRGYRVVTDRIDFAQAPPDGLVIAEWGWRHTLEVSLWPQPEQDSVHVTGRARCLPVR